MTNLILVGDNVYAGAEIELTYGQFGQLKIFLFFYKTYFGIFLMRSFYWNFSRNYCTKVLYFREKIIVQFLCQICEECTFLQVLFSTHTVRRTPC